MIDAEKKGVVVLVMYCGVDWLPGNSILCVLHAHKEKKKK